MLALILGIVGAAVVVAVMLRWWTDGIINGGELFVLSTIYGGLVFGLFMSTASTAAMVTILALLLGSVGWILYRNQKEGLRQYYKEKIKSYELAIRADPTNSAARSAMAEAYYSLGDLDKAIDAMELAGQSGRFSIKENHRLKDWNEQRQLRDSKTIVCRNCHGKNIWGAAQCRICDQPLCYTVPWHESLLESESGRRILCVAVVWMIVLVCSLAFLPRLQGAIVSVCFAMAALGWLMLSSKS